MRFVNQNGFSVEVDPVCENLFRRRGWTPVVEVKKIKDVVQATEEVVIEQPKVEVEVIAPDNPTPQMELPIDSNPLKEEKPTVKPKTQPKKTTTTKRK